MGCLKEGYMLSENVIFKFSEALVGVIVILGNDFLKVGVLFAYLGRGGMQIGKVP